MKRKPPNQGRSNGRRQKRAAPTGRGYDSPQAAAEPAGGVDSRPMSARVPKLVAHRGYRALYPENTLLALDEAIKAGARYLSVDVQLTRDRIPMLCHERSLERMTGDKRDVTDVDAADLATLRASESWRFGPNKFADVPLATLADAAGLLAAYPEVSAFVEVREESLDRHGVEAVHDAMAAALAAVPGQVVWVSYSTDYLLHVRAKSRQPVGVAIREWEEREVAAMRSIRPEYLYCDVRGLPDGGRLAYEQARLVAFEVEEGRQAMELGRRGVEFVATYDVGDMLAYLNRQPNR